MATYPGDLLKTVAGPAEPRPAVVLLTVQRPGAVEAPASTMSIDPGDDDDRLGFRPVTQ